MWAESYRSRESGVELTLDNFYEDGDTNSTEEFIFEGGDCSLFY